MQWFRQWSIDKIALPTLATNPWKTTSYPENLLKLWWWSRRTHVVTCVSLWLHHHPKHEIPTPCQPVEGGCGSLHWGDWPKSDYIDFVAMEDGMRRKSFLGCVSIKFNQLGGNCTFKDFLQMLKVLNFHPPTHPNKEVGHYLLEPIFDIKMWTFIAWVMHACIVITSCRFSPHPQYLVLPMALWRGFLVPVQCTCPGPLHLKTSKMAIFWAIPSM